MEPVNQQQESPGTIALIPPTEQQMRLFGGSDIVRISFNPRTPEGAELLFKCTLDQLPRLSDQANKELFVKHVFQHPAERIDPVSGEVSPFLRTVIIDENGNAYDCGSQGVDKTVKILTSVRGDPPWIPPIRAVVISQKTRRGNNWLFLRPNADDIFKNVTQPNTPKTENVNVPDHRQTGGPDGDGVSKPE